MTAPSSTLSARLTALQRWWSGDASRHGLQLMVAVVVAYLASMALGLPESLWAVMSVLIVMRPTTGSTVGAGWERIRGTMIGSAIALAGVWARHQLGIEVRWLTLAVVALLAYASATRPAMRSAPITALIVLNSSGIPGLSALHVAVLRVIEVGIGIVVGLAVSSIGSHARPAARFDAACATWLRHAADDLRASRDGTRSDAERDAAAAAERSRTALRRLAELGMSADREERLFKRRKPAQADEPQRQRHVAAARLMTRTSHDVSVFSRLRSMGKDEDADWPSLWDDLAAALANTADALVDDTPQDLAMLRRSAQQAPVAQALRLLRQDLVGLARMRGRTSGQ